MSVEAALDLVRGHGLFARGSAYEPTLLPVVLVHLDSGSADDAVGVAANVVRQPPQCGSPLLGSSIARALAGRLAEPSAHVDELPDLALWVDRQDAVRLAARAPGPSVALRLATRRDVAVPEHLLPAASELDDPAEVALRLAVGSAGDRSELPGILARTEGRHDRATWLAALADLTDDREAMAGSVLAAALALHYPPWHCTFLAALVGPFPEATARLDPDLPEPFADRLVELLGAPQRRSLATAPTASHPFGATLVALLDDLSPRARTGIANDVLTGWWDRWAGAAETAPPPPAIIGPGGALDAVRPDDGEQYGGSRGITGSELPPPPPPPVPPRPAPAPAPTPTPTFAPAVEVAARSLHVDVTIPDWPGGPRAVWRSFARDRLHRIGVWIGHRSAAQPTTIVGGVIDEDSVVVEGRVSQLDVTFAHDGEATTKALFLPADRTASSQPVEFDLRIGPDAHNVGATVVVSQHGRVLQQAVLRGAVSEQPDDFAEARIDLQTDVLARVPGEVSAQQREPFSAAVATPGSGAPPILLQDGRATVPSSWTEAVRDSVDIVAEALFNTARDLTADSDGSWDSLLRLLAAQGHMLYGWMADNGYEALEAAERIQLTDADPTEVMPVELVYDRGSVATTAVACPGWATALDTGLCPSCDPNGGEQQPHVCPLGFWGLRKVIERQTGTGDGRPPGHLRPMRSVVFAASGEVLEDDYEATRGTLREVLQMEPVEIHSWDRWNEIAQAAQPTLAVVLPHQGFDDAVKRDFLEIGASSRLPAGDVRYRVLRTDPEPGPIVLLLGCKTAASSVRYRSFAAEFRSAGASIVVATLATVLGRNAAPVAQQFIRELAAIPPTGLGFGEVIRSVRRKMVGAHNPAALGLVSFGDSDWTLA